MHIQTYAHGSLDAVPFSGSLRSPLGEIGIGITIAPYGQARTFFLPFACGYQWTTDTMLTRIMSVRAVNQSPGEGYDVCIPTLGDSHCVTVSPRQETLAYLLMVDMTAYGGFENVGEAERAFTQSLMYDDILFWQGLRAALSQISYILLNQLPAQGFERLDDDARRVIAGLRLPSPPRGVSAWHNTHAFKIGRNSGFQHARALLRGLPEMPLGIDLEDQLRQQYDATVPAYPGHERMRNPRDGVPSIDMPE